MSPIKEGMPTLWSFVEQIIDDCIAMGYLKLEPETEELGANKKVKS
jgi:hypothetical protein